MTAEVDYIAIASDQLAETASLFSQAFGFARIPDESSSALAGERLLLGDAEMRIIPESARLNSTQKPGALDHIRLRVDDLERVEKRLDGNGVPWSHVKLDDENTQAIKLAGKDCIGVPLLIRQRLTDESFTPPPRANDNFLGIDHVGVASADNANAQRTFCDLLGLPVESQQTDTEVIIRYEQFTSDTYGVYSPPSPKRELTGLRVLFVDLGAFDLEFLQDLNANRSRSGVSTSTSGDRSAIAQYVEKAGEGLHHVALRVKDIDHALAAAAKAGLQTLDESGRLGSRRARIGFLHPGSTHRVLFHFAERGA